MSRSNDSLPANCRRARELIDLTPLASATDRNTLESHLSECAECRAAYAIEPLLRREIIPLVLPTASANFEAHLAASIGLVEAPKRSFSFSPGWNLAIPLLILGGVASLEIESFLEWMVSFGAIFKLGYAWLAGQLTPQVGSALAQLSPSHLAHNSVLAPMMMGGLLALGGLAAVAIAWRD